ncbi:MAG: error-prone DNA polymerase [Pseudomonadota bacterium]
MASSAEAWGEYAELHCLSNFSFLRGASHPQELVSRAQELGYSALAITDECSVAGVVRAHAAARPLGFKLLIGAEFTLACGLKVVVLATSRRGYGHLCRLITCGRRAADKGSYHLTRADLERYLPQDTLLLWLPADEPDAEQGRWLAATWPGATWLGVELFCDGRDRQRLALLQRLSETLDLPRVACGDVHMHDRERRRLQDALTAVRLRMPLTEVGWRLHPNGERHLRDRRRLQRLYPRELLQESARIAARCNFSLDELRYEYPREIVPPGATPRSHLRQLTLEGARQRWPDGVPDAARSQIDYELTLIADLAYEPFFLTVHDVVCFARREGILCQGRGSAANSIVCYCLGVTSINPVQMQMLFERFLSRERNEPPDIDIDFEHERREEVIQYIYTKYGRQRAALAATVITYRPRSALRDLAAALGMDAAEAARLAGTSQWWDGSTIDPQRVREAGFDPQDPRIHNLLTLAREVLGFPRHLSQHVGGFVISEGLLEELVPIENAAMPDRTVIQWDKDDLDDLGLIKVDVLGLGMLTAIRRCFNLVAATTGAPPLTLADVPQEDPQVYAMISRGDTVGVFQIESRAQMSMLPRLKPANYYDLVIEVAIVRPGPIQGDMVHPYLRRRSGAEPVTYPSKEVESVLSRTLGVPIFQEQVMQLAIVAAGFTPGEADRLRRAMAAWKRRGGLAQFEDKLVSGMLARNYEESFARQIFNQILGFGEYGFPESHAASFALLVYVSAWLKCHHPAAFTAALLNSLPMGFYAPAQLVRDAVNHDVEVRAVDIARSQCESSLEVAGDCSIALRLGFDLVKSLSAKAIDSIVAARTAAPYQSVQDLAERATLERRDLEALAAAGALRSLAGHRHRAYWNVAGYTRPMPLAPGDLQETALPMLSVPTEGQDLVADYNSLGLTLGRHPVALLRGKLKAAGIVAASELAQLTDGAQVRVAGLVVTRQRPGTASGVTFVTLEDESGSINIVVWRQLGDTQRRELTESRLLEVRGALQRESGVTHVIASRLVDRSRQLGELLTRSRDFH